MSETTASSERLLHFYTAVCGWLRPAIEALVAEGQVDEVIDGGRAAFERMLEANELAYRDRPHHSMATSVFACAAMLAVFEALRERSVDAHAWGREIQLLPAAPQESQDPEALEAARRSAAQEAAESQASAAPNEFVFEIVEPDEQTDRGMNVTSCAICHLFSRHDAMDLVPYMCALDDVASAAGDQGLRRTGTIALGASHCDFRFMPGGEPQPLAGSYPEQIRQ